MNQSGLSTKNKSLVQLSDKLRDLRFAIRQLREVTRKTAQSDRQSAIYNLAHLLANASDGVFSSAESGLISVLSTDPGSHAGQAAAYGFERYFDLAGVTDADGADSRLIMQRFTRDQYFTTKRILLMTDNPNALVHQENFLQIWEHVSPVMKAMFMDQQFGHGEAARLAACYTLACVKAHPVRVPEQFTHPYREAPMDINVFLASTLSLIAGVTLANEHDPDTEIIYKSCIAASIARYQMVENVLKHSDAETALTRFYAHIMDHLP